MIQLRTHSFSSHFYNHDVQLLTHFLPLFIYSKKINGIWYHAPDTRGMGLYDDDAPADDNRPDRGQR